MERRLPENFKYKSSFAYHRHQRTFTVIEKFVRSIFRQPRVLTDLS